MHIKKEVPYGNEKGKYLDKKVKQYNILGSIGHGVRCGRKGNNSSRAAIDRSD
jgi:hypothetical protein